MSDDEEQYEPKAHKKLLQSISNLGKVQHIRKSTRDELQSQQDEFQLLKSISAPREAYNDATGPKAVGLNDLVQILRSSKRHIETGKKLKNVHGTKKVLEKPLEKPAADRIKRTIGYEGVKKKLGRWDAVVAKQRSAETQVFPMPAETVYIDTSAFSKLSHKRVKSELAKVLEASDMKLRALRKKKIGDTVDEKDLQKQESELLKTKLTRDELFERRKELAYLKMRESQKSAKARMQNKIKSKKYHKLQKRQKMLEQLKQFELLQKTNPEAALEKLNELEKSRVLERASLRHKNTGTWAKNLQVRAKYDKDVRKDLAEQLAVSRQLTEKKKDTESDEEQEKEHLEVKAETDDRDPFNPWTKSNAVTKTAQESELNDPNWRKYWTTRNENEKQLQEHRAEISEVQLKKSKTLKKKVAVTRPNAKSQEKQLKTKKPRSTLENGWLVEEVEPEEMNGKTQSIGDMFEDLEDKQRQKLQKKLQKLAKSAKQLKKPTTQLRKQKTEKDELKNLNDLMFKKSKQRPDIDEALNHDEMGDNVTTATITEPLNKIVDRSKATPVVDTIDPNKVTTITLQQHTGHSHELNNAMGDEEADYEDKDDTATDRQLTISEAFEDDDIVADFNKDKTKDSETKNTEMQLSMPGWGSWAGAGISQDVIDKRNKRLILKLAQTEKRRDENKDHVYINESSNKLSRSHKVSSIPFPFTSLADYESSVRAPIGRNFVTETAFRMLTRPAVITRKGAIIEPMDESELVKPDRRLRHVVDRRIKRIESEQIVEKK